MNKSVVGIIIALLAVGGIAGLILVSSADKSDSSTPTPSSSTHQSDQPAAASSEGTSTQPTSTAEATAVSIENFAFSPKTIQVKVGTTVTWTNKDSDRHDITPDNETDEFKASKLLSKGQSYSVTFKTPGTYSYFCSPHPYMKAAVEVVE